MKTRAPGKVVLSGAYSVLEDAPAIVTAVDRYVVVDTERPSGFFPEEVKAAGFAAPYWFDSADLRSHGRKLGLGSSAAILVAMLAARALKHAPETPDAGLQTQVFEPALLAHRIAQGGGSGIDIAASCFGGTLRFQRSALTPELEPLALPSGLVFEVWASNVEASTQGLIANVKALERGRPAIYRARIDEQAKASRAAVEACRANSAGAFIDALNAQRLALTHLGREAGASIVTAEVQALATEAARLSAAVLPAGAGGGDIALYVGREPSDALTFLLGQNQHTRLDLTLGASGVSKLSSSD